MVESFARKISFQGAKSANPLYKLQMKQLSSIALEVKKSSKIKSKHIVPVMYTYRKNLKLTDIPANPEVLGRYKTVNT